MVKRNNRKRRNQNNGSGTIAVHKMSQIYSNSFATVVGTNSQIITYALICSDINFNRLVKLRSVRIDFSPTVSGAGAPFVQLVMQDPTTGVLLPISRSIELNMTTKTRLSASLPTNSLGFTAAGSGNTAFAIYATSAAVITVAYTLEVQYDVVRDAIA